MRIVKRGHEYKGWQIGSRVRMFGDELEIVAFDESCEGDFLLLKTNRSSTGNYEYATDGLENVEDMKVVWAEEDDIELIERYKDEFRVGDTIYDLVFGKGKIKEISYEDYSIAVAFENGKIEYFTKDGVRGTKGIRTLFFEPIEIQDSAYQRKGRWRAEKGEKYYFTDEFGDVNKYCETFDYLDDKLFKTGNYFQTEEEAKASKFYKVFKEE